MAEPVSLVASIAGVITFTAQAATLIDDFVSSYRDTNSELAKAGTEIRLLEVVLEELEKAYRCPTTIPDSATSGGHGEECKAVPTDATLKTVLDGLDLCMKQLKDVVAKSYQRMGRGGLHKIKVQTLWQRTSKGIDKIRRSLTGYKMTLMLLLEARTLQTNRSSKVNERAVELALKKAESYRNELVMGEKMLIEVRRYLDDIENISTESSDVQIGTTDAVQTFRTFDDWVASFSASHSEKQEDDRLVAALRIREQSTKGVKLCDSSLALENSGVACAPQSKVLLIVTDLQRPTSKNLFVEQLFVDANIEIMEILQILKDKGYSKVTGFRTRGPSREGAIGPTHSVSAPVPVAVTTARSCYDVSKGLRINQDETFVSFYNKYIMQRRPQRSELSVTHSLDCIQIKDCLTGEECKITFKRTLRVPEGMGVHNTPRTFGPFPLIDVSKCENMSNLRQIKDKGGLLIPLLQREALCVEFKPGRDPRRRENMCLFSTRLFAGSSNAVSGRPSTELTDDEQDYIVVPLQKRVDGFNDTHGCNVKQFVAAPLGCGYSVETQLTGNEIGGLQLQIAPRMKTDVEFEGIGSVDGPIGAKLPLLSSPRNVGLTNGQLIRMTGQKDHSPVAPWNWDPAKNRAFTDIMIWAMALEREAPIENRENCWRCSVDSKYWQRVRPAYLSDLLNDAGIEQQGALAVSALPPISVTLNHFAESRGDAPERLLFSTSLQVSSFERVEMIKCRMLHVLKQWLGERSMLWSEVIFRSSTCLNYNSSFQDLGITEKYVIETEEGFPALLPAPPTTSPSVISRKPTGWEMALAAGGTIRQDIKVDPSPGYWNWDAAHFINIQILNTVAFESVTGIAPPLSPISFEEYRKAGIPSMSFYSADLTHPPVRGNFSAVRTVGQMDAMLDITYAARLSAEGSPVGCVVCERMICDAVLEPCHHAFCTTCIRFRMRRAGQITCLLCSRASTKIIISSAVMEISSPAPIRQQQAEGLGCSTSGAPECTDNLHSLSALERTMGMAIQWNNDKEGREYYVRSMLGHYSPEGDSELKCRLALAQLLKDIDNPWKPPADFVTAAVSPVFEEVIQNYSHDLVEVLLGISVSSGDRSALSQSILRRACSHRTEEFAKRLVDEGYDWRTLKKKLRKDEKRCWSASESWRMAARDGFQWEKRCWSLKMLKGS